MNTTAITTPTAKTLLPKLVQKSSTYKLIVPQKVEKKIRYLLRKFPSTEWSGVLFYTHQGSFENNDLVLTCQDIFPMDLGTAGWTEFHMSEDVASYMADNIELFDCETGLIHSHHNMGAFFSSQDNLMLQQEGNDTNCFVSLVVDTKGTYVARITRKVQTKAEVTTRNLGSSYEFFGEGSHTIANDNSSTTQVVSDTVIEYFNLDIQRHVVVNSFDYLDARFDEIQRKKQRAMPKYSYSVEPLQQSDSSNKGFFDTLHSKGKSSAHHFNAYTNVPNTKNSNKESDDSIYNWHPDHKKIHHAVVRMLICSLIVNPDKVDLNKWVANNMVTVYRRIFGEYSEQDCIDNSCSAFSEWRDFITQHTIDYFDYDDVPDYLMQNDYNHVASIVAQAIIDELSAFKNPNIYINSYIDSLYLNLLD